MAEGILEPIKGNFKILIVEDNEINLLYFSMLLKELCPNASVFQAANGKIALQYLSDNKLDIIFLDLYLPDMDGFEIIKLIRNDFNYDFNLLPVIALTSLSSDEDKHKVFESGMNAFLPKLASKENIYSVLRKYLLNTPQTVEIDFIKVHNLKRHFCKDELFDKIGYDRDFFNSLFDIFVDIYNKNSKAIIDASSMQDYDAIVSLLHHIKGGASSLCFEKMTAIINAFQNINFKDNELFNTMMSEMNTEYAYLLNFFKKENNIFDND